jgi:carbamoyl-phosphate synthase large subunit
MFCDAYWVVPPAVSGDYVERLLSICEAEGVHVVFPIVDSELDVLAAVGEAFNARGVKVWMSPRPTIEVCNDKYLTYEFFVSHNIPTPHTWLPEHLLTPGQLDYPVIVKPRRGVSSRGVMVVTEPNCLHSAIRQTTLPIIQTYVAGGEYTIDVLTDEEGTVLSAVPRERVEVKAGITTKGRTVKDERMISEATEIAAALGIRGPCNIQCISTEQANVYIEVNPRFSGGLPLTVAAGVNGPLALMDIALSELAPQNIGEFQENVWMARYWQEVIHYP